MMAVVMMAVMTVAGVGWPIVNGAGYYAEENPGRFSGAWSPVFIRPSGANARADVFLSVI